MISSFNVKKLVKVRLNYNGIDKVVDAKKGDKIGKIAFQNGAELPFSCGGLCQCGTCHVYIRKGWSCLMK